MSTCIYVRLLLSGKDFAGVQTSFPDTTTFASKKTIYNHRHSLTVLLNKIISAAKIHREHGGLRLLKSIIEELQKSDFSVFNTYIHLILNKIHLLIDEKSIAYMSGQNWSIISLTNIKKDRVLPTLSSFVYNTRHGSSKHIRMMEVLYTYDGFARVENDDIVVDVGAYVGGFTIFASKYAKKVIAIEPNESESNILSTNVGHLNNVTIVPKAGWKRKETLEINQSARPNENSVLSPDNNDINTSINVEADTIPNIVRETGYKKIDYLKIEAEGVEPEILEGALNDGMQINKIAVDASKERDGEDTISEVVEILDEFGYASRTKENERWWGEYIVFGKK